MGYRWSLDSLVFLHYFSLSAHNNSTCLLLRLSVFLGSWSGLIFREDSCSNLTFYRQSNMRHKIASYRYLDSVRSNISHNSLFPKERFPFPSIHKQPIFLAFPATQRSCYDTHPEYTHTISSKIASALATKKWYPDALQVRDQAPIALFYSIPHFWWGLSMCVCLVW